MSEPAKKEPYGAVDYADPGYQSDKKKRYPIDTAEHVRAAWSYINKGADSGKYSSEQLAHIKGKIRAAAKKFGINIANELPEPQIFVNVATIDDKGHVQLAPYGDFLNVDAKGHRVIQRFEKTDAEEIVNDFKRLSNLPTRLLGLPWYIGHPDHPRFRNVHVDGRSYGRVKSLEAGDDGLYGNVTFGSAGKALLDDEAFHGHSVNWRCMPAGRDRGLPVYRPVALKSVGFTNEPAIPVLPASLANEDISELANDFDQPMTDYAVGPNQGTDDMIIPPRLKLIAGFKADDNVTMEQILAALEKTHAKTVANEETDMTEQTKPVELTIGDEKFSVVFANEESAKLPERITKLGADKTKAETDLANAETARKAERKARAELVVDSLVKTGKIVTKDRDAKIEELCNAEDFDAKSKEFANAGVTVKTKAKSSELAGKHATLSNDLATRQVKFNSLMSARSQTFPNESYDDRFNAVMSSEEGQQLFAQMERPESEKAA